MLLFWEKYKTSVFTQGSEEQRIISELLLMWYEVYDITGNERGATANWSLPVAEQPATPVQVPGLIPVTVSGLSPLEESIKQTQEEREALEELVERVR